jgi:hypothetical protein
LSYVNQLTSVATYRLRIELQESGTGKWYSVEYSTFSVGDEATTQYTLSLSGLTGDSILQDPMLSTQPSGLLLYGAAGRKFTTNDVDNDNNVLLNCASLKGGGWWFSNCYYFCPTCASSNNGVGNVYASYFYWQKSRMLMKSA